MAVSVVRHVWSEAEERWYEIRMDYREPGRVLVRPTRGTGARSVPTVVFSLEAALDFVKRLDRKEERDDDD